MYECEECGTMYPSITAARECEILDNELYPYDED